MSKHTETPWRYSPVSVVSPMRDWVPMYEVYTDAHYVGFALTEADARLIAASPDLLVACKALLEHEGTREVNGIGMECDSVALERAKQLASVAITKAEI